MLSNRVIATNPSADRDEFLPNWGEGQDPVALRLPRHPRRLGHETDGGTSTTSPQPRPASRKGGRASQAASRHGWRRAAPPTASPPGDGPMTADLFWLTLTALAFATLWLPYIVGVNMANVPMPADNRPTDPARMPAWVHRACGRISTCWNSSCPSPPWSSCPMSRACRMA